MIRALFTHLNHCFYRSLRKEFLNNLDMFHKYGNLKMYKVRRAVLKSGVHASACWLVSHISHFVAGASDTSEFPSLFFSYFLYT